MSDNYFIECDNDNCCNKTYPYQYGQPTFTKILVGGSDFDMSFNGGMPTEYDFCSLDCLQEWLDSIM